MAFATAACVLIGSAVASVVTPVYFKLGQTKATQLLPTAIVVLLVVPITLLGNLGILEGGAFGPVTDLLVFPRWMRTGHRGAGSTRIRSRRHTRRTRASLRLPTRGTPRSTPSASLPSMNLRMWTYRIGPRCAEFTPCMSEIYITGIYRDR